MQVRGSLPLAQARTGPGVGPVGGAFFDENVDTHNVFKRGLRRPLGDANLCVSFMFLMIWMETAPKSMQIVKITVNRLICGAPL